MAQEYFTRTRSFAGRISTRFPLYLYKNAESYRQHPGIVPGSAGIYNGKSLVATAPSPRGSWRVVQHEGFHQFAHKMIKGRLPIWLNEGLAEYFGNGVWTGDSLVVGVMSPSSVARVKSAIKSNSLISLDKMLAMTHAEWNSALSSTNYLQAWSMIHFLVHADKGKYQKALSGYIRELSIGRSSTIAFRKYFGTNIKAFQACYAQWWNKLGENPSADLYDRIRVLTLTSYLARAYYTRRKFETVEEYFKAAGDGTFKKIFEEIGKRKAALWLPESLLTRTLPPSGQSGTWSLLPRSGGPRLQYMRGDDTGLVGSFRLMGSKISVTVEPTRPPKKKPVKPTVKRPVSKNPKI